MSNLYTYAQVRHPARSVAMLVLFAVVASVRIARADAPAPPPTDPPLVAVLRDLVAEAQLANEELAGAGFGVEQRLAALDGARARYWPQLDLQARYSAADGGRTIDLPVGDLLNPLYASLARLEPGTSYPTVANQQIRFLRSREQETKFIVTQPLYDARIGAGRDYAAADVHSAQASLEALRGRVTRDVEQAYLRLLEARADVAVLDATLELGRENLKVNESLVRNGKATRDVVYRAEADLLETTQRRLAASNAVDIGRSYVNLLRNVALDAPLRYAGVDEAGLHGLSALYVDGDGHSALADLQAEALERRGELKVLDAEHDAARASEALARAGFKPTLGFSVEAGTQGETYGLAAGDRYVLASLVLRFNLFDGGGDRAAVRGAHAVANQIQAQRTDTENRVRLEVQQALQNFAVARASIDTAEKRLQASRAAFRISQKKRDLGQINQAEYIDARRALTDAALNLNQTRFGALSSLAELDYAAGRADRTLKNL